MSSGLAPPAEWGLSGSPRPLRKREGPGHPVSGVPVRSPRGSYGNRVVGEWDPEREDHLGDRHRKFQCSGTVRAEGGRRDTDTGRRSYRWSGPEGWDGQPLGTQVVGIVGPPNLNPYDLRSTCDPDTPVVYLEPDRSGP